MATLDEEFAGAFADLMKEANKDLSPAQLAAQKVEADAAAAKTPEEIAAEAADAARVAAAAPVVTEQTAEEKAAAEAAKAAAITVVPPTEEEIAEKAAADAAKATAAEAAEAARNADDERLARFAEKIAEKTTPKPTTKVTEAAAPSNPFTTEEIKTIAGYEKDWPDVFKANAIIRRAENVAIVNYMAQEFAKVLAPMQEKIEALSGRQTEIDLNAAIPDYDTVYDQVAQWVDKQPGYLQPALKHVIEHGTPDEVTDLVGRWRKDTGNTAAKPAAQVPVVKKDTELSPATKKAVAALAPVGSKRTAIIGNAAAEDYDSAFLEAAKIE